MGDPCPMHKYFHTILGLPRTRFCPAYTTADKHLTIHVRSYMPGVLTGCKRGSDKLETGVTSSLLVGIKIWDRIPNGNAEG